MSPAGQVQVRVVAGPGPELDELLPAWDALARQHARGVAGRPSYALSWWYELGEGSLALVVAFRAGRLVAVAPLHRRVLLGQPVLRWLGHGLGTIGEVVAADEAAAAAVWDALADRGEPLQLTHVRLDDLGTLALRRSPRWSVRLVVDDRVPTLALPAGTTPSDLRSARSLKRLGNYRDALAREGRPFDVEVVTDVEALRSRWPDVQRVAADADRGRARQNLCAPPYDRFTLRFLEQEACAGGLLLVGGTVGDSWVAHEVGLRSGRRVDLWLSRFDPTLDRFALGHLVMRRLIERHDELTIEELDFGLGENAYKLAWTAGGYDVGTLTAAARRPVVTAGRLALARTAGALSRRMRR